MNNIKMAATVAILNIRTELELLDSDIGPRIMPYSARSNLKNFKMATITAILDRPRHEKTCLWGLQRSETPTSLPSYRD